MNRCLVSLAVRRTTRTTRTTRKLRSTRPHPLARRAAAAALLALPLTLRPAADAGAQIVTPRTVPVLQDAQFSLFPSSRAGMANASLALDDTLLDPWSNPAKTARVPGSLVFAVPSSHSLSRGGGGLTLPLGGIATRGAWSVGAIGAMQSLDRAGPARNDPSATNRYAMGTVARRLRDGYRVGGSLYAATLGAVDGVDLLYGGGDRIAQSGRSLDARLGVTRDWATSGRSLELLLVHNRFDMSHDVHYTTQVYDPTTRTWTPTQRDEHNADRTSVWGGHTRFQQSLGDGLRVGVAATMNVLSHPKIPNYGFMNIPRDPGTTWAYAFGAGMAQGTGPTIFAADLAIEPMRSTTWAEAARDTMRTDGVVLRAGEHTVDNRMHFRNTRLRLGLQHDTRLDSAAVVRWQFGLDVTSVGYSLEQIDEVRRTARKMNDGWAEVSPTFGLALHDHLMTLQYTARVTCTSDCLPMGDKVTAVAAGGSGGVIAAPRRAGSFRGGGAFLHQVTVAVPLR